MLTVAVAATTMPDQANTRRSMHRPAGRLPWGPDPIDAAADVD